MQVPAPSVILHKNMLIVHFEGTVKAIPAFVGDKLILRSGKFLYLIK
ncbi:MAG: hypothetical protein J7L95_05910 [Prolixibacteraceae bacterium]|nr:hypothetical protein [Prolixibacteraceae bacterium]